MSMHDLTNQPHSSGVCGQWQLVLRRLNVSDLFIYLFYFIQLMIAQVLTSTEVLQMLYNSI